MLGFINIKQEKHFNGHFPDEHGLAGGSLIIRGLK